MAEYKTAQDQSWAVCVDLMRHIPNTALPEFLGNIRVNRVTCLESQYVKR